MVPDYGDSGAWFQPVSIPERGEEGYLSPAERVAGAREGDPWAPVIAREQAIAEYLDAHPVRMSGPPGGPQEGDAGVGADGGEVVYGPGGWEPVPEVAEPEAGG